MDSQEQVFWSMTKSHFVESVVHRLTMLIWSPRNRKIWQFIVDTERHSVAESVSFYSRTRVLQGVPGNRYCLIADFGLNNYKSRTVTVCVVWLSSIANRVLSISMDMMDSSMMSTRSFTETTCSFQDRALSVQEDHFTVRWLLFCESISQITNNLNHIGLNLTIHVHDIPDHFQYALKYIVLPCISLQFKLENNFTYIDFMTVFTAKKER